MKAAIALTQETTESGNYKNSVEKIKKKCKHEMRATSFKRGGKYNKKASVIVLLIAFKLT